MFLYRVFALIVISTIAGCARKASTESRPIAAGTASRSSDVISAAELAAPSVVNGDALEAVRRLRPRFLSARGASSIRVAGAGAVHVSIDGGNLLTVSHLSRMRPGDISEIRYLNASEATQRFGTNAAMGGVLLVKSR
jgi:hypothetical protein